MMLKTGSPDLRTKFIPDEVYVNMQVGAHGLGSFTRYNPVLIDNTEVLIGTLTNEEQSAWHVIDVYVYKEIDGVMYYCEASFDPPGTISYPGLSTLTKSSLQWISEDDGEYYSVVDDTIMGCLDIRVMYDSVHDNFPIYITWHSEVIEPEPSFSVEITDTTNSGPYIYGDTIDLKITVTNTGNISLPQIITTYEVGGDEWGSDSLSIGEHIDYDEYVTVNDWWLGVDTGYIYLTATAVCDDLELEETTELYIEIEHSNPSLSLSNITLNSLPNNIAAYSGYVSVNNALINYYNSDINSNDVGIKITDIDLNNTGNRQMHNFKVTCDEDIGTDWHSDNTIFPYETESFTHYSPDGYIFSFYLSNDDIMSETYDIHLNAEAEVVYFDDYDFSSEYLETYTMSTLTYSIPVMFGWVFIINTEATAAGETTTGIPFTLYNISGITLYVDWGDSTSSTLTSANYTSSDFTASTHTYASAGIYVVTVRCSSWSNLGLQVISGGTNISTVNNKNRPFYLWRRTLVMSYGLPPVNKCLSLNTSGTIGNYTDGCIWYLFSYCTKLEDISTDLLKRCPSITKVTGLFYDCSSLSNLEATMFEGSNIEEFNYCFHNCTSLASIPSTLFTYSPDATTFASCFRGCTALAAIPSGLFNDNTHVTTFANCFRGDTSIASIPSDLFANNTSITTLEYCLYSCSALNGFTIHIGSSDVSNANYFVTRKTNVARIVYVPENSTTHTTFNTLSSDLTIIPE